MVDVDLLIEDYENKVKELEAEEYFSPLSKPQLRGGDEVA